jgi:beta-lactamase superfamily II metal-dependent hydrolase
MIFSLDVRRARKGDCLILHFGTKQEPGLVLIDGGPKSVYAPHLKPRLLQIRKARKIEKNDPLPVDVLMVSHVDDDHIQGILDFTREEIANVEAHGPRLLNVSSLWHNSFDEIIGSEPKMVTAKVTGTFKTEASTGEVTLSDDKVGVVEDIFLDQNAGGNDEEGKELVGSTLKVLASISQGFRLRKDAERLGYERNLEFDKAPIVAMEGQETPTIAGSLKATIVGPMRDEILALHKKHQEWLEQLKAQGKTPEEALAAYVDKSVPNLSSIVVLMEAAGKKILLTGDARGDKVLEGLQLVRRLGNGKDSTIEVDILKVPHHGSSNNLDNDFFERILAKHYVFSGDGEHGNPERESMEMLLRARGNTDYEIHLTYDVKDIDEGREKDWNKERNKEVARKTKKGTGEVREKWSPEDHGLVAFFDANPSLKQKLRIVDEKKPHVIDLAEKLTDSWPALAD